MSISRDRVRDFLFRPCSHGKICRWGRRRHHLPDEIGGGSGVKRAEKLPGDMNEMFAELRSRGQLGWL